MKLEWNCEVTGCGRFISIEMIDNPTGDARRAKEETEAAFERQIKAHLSTHTRIGYQPAEIPPGRRVMGPDEEA